MVFICHSSADKEFAETLSLDLQTQGIEVWIDLWDVRVGDSLHDVIGKALSRAALVVVVLSPASVASRWCMDEVNQTLAREKQTGQTFVLPVLVSRCHLPAFLQDPVYADFQQDYRKGLNCLARTIRDRLPKHTESSLPRLTQHFAGLWTFGDSWYGSDRRSVEISPSEVGRMIQQISTADIRADGVSLLYPTHVSDETATIVLEALRASSLKCGCLVVDYGDLGREGAIGSPHDEVRDAARARARAAVALAPQLGCRLVVLWTAFEKTQYQFFSAPRPYHYLCDSLAAIADSNSHGATPVVCVESNFEPHVGTTQMTETCSVLNAIDRTDLASRIGISIGMDLDMLLGSKWLDGPWGMEMFLVKESQLAVQQVHLRINHKSCRSLRSFLSFYAYLLRYLRDNEYKADIVHSVLPWDQGVGWPDADAWLHESVRISREVEIGLSNVDWDRYRDMCNTRGKLRADRMLAQMLGFRVEH